MSKVGDARKKRECLEEQYDSYLEEIYKATREEHALRLKYFGQLLTPPNLIYSSLTGQYIDGNTGKVWEPEEATDERS